MLSLKGFRSRAKGLPDLLPYAVLVAPGVVLNKDGSFLAAWEFEGRDTASSTEEELDYVAEQVNQALLPLGNGWMLHVDAVRRPATSYPREDQSHFPDAVSKMIDDERRAFFEGAECFVTNTVLTATYKAAGGGLTAGVLGTSQGLDHILSEFLTRIDNLESALSGVLRLSRLEEYESADEFGERHLFSTLLSHIEDTITGRWPCRPSPCTWMPFWVPRIWWEAWPPGWAAGILPSCPSTAFPRPVGRPCWICCPASRSPIVSTPVTSVWTSLRRRAPLMNTARPGNSRCSGL
jgi:hypothetical protein